MGKNLDALKIPFYAAHPTNYTPGRGRPIKFITIHHMGGTPNTLRNMYADPLRNGCATFGVFPGYIEQYLSISNTPWTNGNFASNQESITIEVYGDWRNGRTYPVLDQLKKLIRAIRLDIASLEQNYHQDVSLKFTECPAQLRAHAQRIFDELTREFNAPAPQPQPKITYKPITPKTIITKWETNLWNFNFSSWPAAKPVKGYPKGYVVERIVAIATNQLGGKYYMTEHSYNDGKIRATNGFNIADVEDFKPAPVPQPDPKPTPPKEALIDGLKFTRYDNPIVVETAVDKVKLWDFNYKTWGDISAHPVDEFKKGHEITIVGDVQHPLGGVYAMTEYSLGDGDVKDPNFKPHKTWGVNVVDVKEKAVLDPAPVPEPQPDPEIPVSDEDIDLPDIGPGDLLDVKPGENAYNWLTRVWRWVVSVLKNFKFGG